MLRDKVRASKTMTHFIQLCEEGEGNGGSGFIKMVNSAPFPMMVMAQDYSLDDLVRFCTSSYGFSILGVDPTFNLGEFRKCFGCYISLCTACEVFIALPWQH